MSERPVSVVRATTGRNSAVSVAMSFRSIVMGRVENRYFWFTDVVTV